MKHVVNNLEAHFKIKRLEAFRSHGWTEGVPRFSGGPWVTGAYGVLPEEYHAEVDQALYVVWSYETPIAWLNGDGTYSVPDVGYSPTTSQHQMIAKAAFGVTAFPRRGREVVPAGGGPRSGGIDS